MRKYCEVCGRDVNTKVVKRKESFDICGEMIETDAQVLVCTECGEDLYCEEFDNNTLIGAYNEYRRRHRLLLPEEIKKIREQYDLSQRALAKLLNWGDKTIFRYENGSIQDKAHNSMLLFLRDPENMKTYLVENETALNERQKRRLLDIVDKLEQNEVYHREKLLSHLLTAKDPCEENGYRTFDYDKFCAMVLFFAHKSTELLKTKLMKLLNYSDMVFYKENGISISGARYIHLPYGPVPEHFDFLIGMMTEDHIAHIEVTYQNGYEKHQMVPEKAVVPGVLSEEELAVMEKISDRFKNFGSADISDYSHKEKGYTETKTGEVISYSYAGSIDLN